MLHRNTRRPHHTPFVPLHAAGAAGAALALCALVGCGGALPTSQPSTSTPVDHASTTCGGDPRGTWIAVNQSFDAICPGCSVDYAGARLQYTFGDGGAFAASYGGQSTVTRPAVCPAPHADFAPTCGDLMRDPEATCTVLSYGRCSCQVAATVFSPSGDMATAAWHAEGGAMVIAGDTRLPHTDSYSYCVDGTALRLAALGGVITLDRQ